MTEQKDSFSKWYETNADDYNARRRERYQNDPEYRARVRSSSNKKTIGKPVTLMLAGVPVKAYPISYVADTISATKQSIINWEKNGWIPKPTLEHRTRHYTKGQVVLLRKLKRFIMKSNNRPDKGALEAKISQIAEEW